MVDNKNEKCCTCTTPEITIKLNKQGPQGLTGPKGEDGFSPIINVAEDTLSTYTLNITSKEGTITTPNLKATIPSAGLAGDVLTKVSDREGDYNFQPLPIASESNNGIVTLATYEGVENPTEDNEDDVITNSILQRVVAEKLQPKGNYVTIEGSETIEGYKTFSNTTKFANYISYPTSRLNYGEMLKGSDEDGIVFGNIYDPMLVQFSNSLDTYNGLVNSIRGIKVNGLSTTPRQEVLQVKYNNEVYNVITNGDIASTTSLGIVKPDGNTITIDPDGTLHSTGSYTLPIASATELGGVKVGEGLEISTDGVLNATAPTIDTTNLAKLNEVNEFTQRNTFRDGLYVKGSSSFGQDTKGIILSSTDNNGYINTYGGIDIIRISVNSTTSNGLAIGTDSLTYTNSNGEVTDLLNNVPSNVLTSDNIDKDSYIASLEARIKALETEINGGGADGSPNVEVRGIVESFKNNSTPVGDTLGNITETYRNEVS